MTLYKFHDNKMTQIDETTFFEEGIKETQNLQNALKRQIDVVCPDSIVIADEYSSWEDSQRRMDLLAIDKDANIVVIELKRNKSGDHMELQAIRYAAMISTLTFSQAVDTFQNYLDKDNEGGKQEINAEQELLDFLEVDSPPEEFGKKVRIVLVSADFSTELTASVLWLLDMGIDISCVRLKPYKYDNNIFIDADQIIPLPEADEYRIKILAKLEETKHIRKSNRDKTQYKFNDQVYGKSRLVLAVIQEWMRNNKPQKIDELFEVFPNDSTHGYGQKLVKPKSSAELLLENKGYKRHFIKEEELLNFSEDGLYALTNQWSHKTIQSFLDIAKAEGFVIETIT